MTTCETKRALTHNRPVIDALAVNVCVRKATNSVKTCSNRSMVAASDSDIADTPPALVFNPIASPITSDKLLNHFPMSDNTILHSLWSLVAQSLCDNLESPIFISYALSDQVMLRLKKNQSPAAALLSQNDRPNVISEAVGGACYRELNDRDCRSMLVHNSRILCRFQTHASENKENTDELASIN